MRTVVVGIGNPVLRDDAVGVKVAQHFEGLVDTEILMTTDFKVLDKLLGYDRAVIVDGVRLGHAPGTVLEFNVDDLLFTYTYSGTHNLSLPTTLKIGYELFAEEMPREIRIVTVEVEDVTTFGTDCTPAVEKAIPEAVRRVRHYLESGSGK
ncbi:MAG: hydrogenase maturation protease [Bacillota bacterium]